ncbi:MAG: iron donor protein CyaY [Polyangiaceae bacterium]|nr:iron donor protein CyaY [Polyangiaceae bacterium]
MTTDDAGFDLLADRTLTSLVAALDREDGVEAELSMGVLTISFDAGGAAFVVNSHRAAGQIWLAADRAAWHFDPVDGGARWVATKPPREELHAALSAALSRRLGRAVELRTTG